MPREMNPEIKRIMEQEGLKYPAAKMRYLRGKGNVTSPVAEPQETVTGCVTVGPVVTLPATLRRADPVAEPVSLQEIVSRLTVVEEANAARFVEVRSLEKALQALTDRVAELENGWRPVTDSVGDQVKRAAGSGGGKSQFSLSNTQKVLPRR